MLGKLMETVNSLHGIFSFGLKATSIESDSTSKCQNLHIHSSWTVALLVLMTHHTHHNIFHNQIHRRTEKYVLKLAHVCASVTVTYYT